MTHASVIVVKNTKNAVENYHDNTRLVEEFFE